MMGKILKTHDEFLGAAKGSSGGSFLKDWKKNGFADPDDPQYRCIDTWMHMISVPQMRWHHPWRRIKKTEDKDTKIVTNEVWSDEFVCHEELNILNKQYARDDRDQREAFPETCPSCRLIECVYQLVRYSKFVVGGTVIATGKINWTEPLFVYDASDQDKTVVLHAAGLYNGYKDVESGSEEGKELKAAGIVLLREHLRAAWKENVNAKKSWMFAIVDNTDVVAGVQITEESSLLGEKVSEVVTKSRTSKKKGPTDTEDLGNPFKYPFGIRWKHTDNKKLPFNKKYDALKMEALELTEPISKLIRSEPRDWFSSKLKEGDAATFRAVLQKHATEVASKILPWDWIFAGHESMSASGERRDSRVVLPATAPTPQAPAPATAQPSPAPMRRKVMAAPPPPPPEPERILCGDGCDYMLLPTDAVCPKCNAKYDVLPAPQVAPASVAMPVQSNGANEAPRPSALASDPDPQGDGDLPF